MYQFKSVSDKNKIIDLINFNTSHVSVQVYDEIVLTQNSLVSIHLMYQFKIGRFHINELNLLFQYISCISSRSLLKVYKKSVIVSIHLMYQFKTKQRKKENLFDFSFNTSHVSVQESPLSSFLISSILFQYISCISSS